MNTSLIFHIGIFYMIMLFLQGEGIIDKISVFEELKDIVRLIDGWSRHEIPETTLTLNSTMALDVDSLKINVLINGPIQFDKSELKHKSHCLDLDLNEQKTWHNF